jgi:glycosyltransferase involved in cell wall biosynthesis
VVFPARDEDYGLVTIEAFASAKAVITCRDSGGAAELVETGRSGIVCEATPASIAQALGELAADQPLAERMGAEASRVAAGITWPRAIETLILR